MTIRKIGRRWFLLGAGGAAVMIPELPSLLGGPFQARKASAQAGSPKRMVTFMTQHGGVWQQDMFPDESDASAPMDHPLHPTFQGDLRSRVDGGDRVISEALRAPEGLFTEALAGKMNLMRGLDVPFYYGHARHILGNYGDLSNNHDKPTPEQETADQVMAHSSAFYPDTPRRRVVYFGYHAMSVEYRDRDRGSAGGFRSAEQAGPTSVFDAVFVAPEMGEPTRPPPIDKVHASYQRLISAASSPGARLGVGDRRRIGQYMDQLSDIRASLTSEVGSYCGDVVRPEGLGGAAREYPASSASIINDVVLASFMCDSSRIAVIGTNEPFHGGMGAYGGFHEVAHAANSMNGSDRLTQLRNLMCENNANFFRQGFLDLVSKLDSLEETDGSMLDNSLVWWGNESGSCTHRGDSIPIITAGSAGGTLNTGKYLDYRNRDSNPFGAQDRFSNVGRRQGACLFQWTTTYLDAFGIPRNEWQVDGRKAFSGMSPNSNVEIRYDLGAMDASCDSPLPGLIRT